MKWTALFLVLFLMGCDPGVSYEYKGRKSQQLIDIYTFDHELIGGIWFSVNKQNGSVKLSDFLMLDEYAKHLLKSE